jgi:hypothetical protein
MRASVALPSSAGLAETAAGWSSRAAAIAERRRWWIIGLCILGQWAFLGREVHGAISHNGWLFQNGDDGPWYWTTAWALTSLHAPITAVGAGWPYLLTPLAAIFGPNMANGLPAVIALNVLVLGPASVVGMFLLGERIAGRVFGVWTAVLWTLMPLLAIELYTANHRTYLVDFFLPTGTGLNALSDYPSMVCAIFCAYLVLRALDSNDVRDGVLAGILLGFLVLMKPANGPLPLVGVVVLGVTMRFRALLGTVVVAVPAAVALLVWKELGTGTLPAFSGGGGGGGATAVVHNAHNYVNINFHQLMLNTHELREVFWSLRLLEFLLVAGSIGLIGRTRWKGAFVVAWFVSFGLIKGTVSYSNVYDTSLYRFLLPAWPAWTVIVAGVVLCWPAARVRRAATNTSRGVDWRILAGAALVFALGPFLLIVADSPAKPGAIIDENSVGAPIPVVDFGVQAHQIGTNAVRFTWKSMSTKRAATTYAIFKAADDGCGQLDPAHPLCRFKMQLIGTTHTTGFVDSQAVTRRLYRVGLIAGTTVQVDNPSMLLMSKPISFTPQ